MRKKCVSRKKMCLRAYENVNTEKNRKSEYLKYSNK